MDRYAWPNRTTPLESEWSVGLSATTVESERFILLSVYISFSLLNIVFFDAGNDG